MFFEKLVDFLQFRSKAGHVLLRILTNGQCWVESDSCARVKVLTGQRPTSMEVTVIPFFGIKRDGLRSLELRASLPFPFSSRSCAQEIAYSMTLCGESALPIENYQSFLPRLCAWQFLNLIPPIDP